MPYKSEKIKIERTEYDRRIKLSDEQKKEIIELHSSGVSQRQIARIYRVDRRLISFIIHPEYLKENIKRREERGGWKIYYDKEKARIATKDHRDYKQRLKLSGKIN